MEILLHHRRSGRLIRVALLFSAALALAGITAWGQSAKLERPVMIESNGPGSELFVVDASGHLHEFRVQQNGLQEFRTVSLPSEFTPADMTYESTPGQQSLLIAGTEEGRGVVMLYFPDGTMHKTFECRNIYSGIDFGPKTRSAYVATSDSNEIYKLDLEKSQPAYVARIESATKLGPVALNEGQQEIFVADVAAGRVYEYSIAAKTSRILLTNLSAPTALAFDPETNRLFVADPGLGGIIAADTRATKPVATEFAAKSLKSPYGMTLISNGRVAVADYGANNVAVFSPKGELLFRSPQ